MKRLFLVLVLLLFISSFVIADGGDAIFEELGMDKPSEWDDWSREERFDYLASLELSPGEDGKYTGDAGDLTEYFSILGLTEPSNWDSMSFDEKKAYVTVEEETVVEEEPLTEEVVVEDSFDEWLYLLVLVVCVVLTFVGLRFRKIFSNLIYYLLPLVLLVLSFILGGEYFRILGIFSEVLLVWLLFVKPLSVIFKSKYLVNVVGFRRQLGVATFWTFFFHGVGLYFLYGMSFSSVVSNLLWGFLAGIGLLVLFVTSNDYSMKLLKKNWKWVQRLAYPVLFGVLLHSSLKTTMVKFYVVVGLFVVLKVVEWSRKFFK